MLEKEALFTGPGVPGQRSVQALSAEGEAEFTRRWHRTEIAARLAGHRESADPSAFR